MTVVPDLRPRKSLGQHFLRDQNIARKIVAALRPEPSDVLLEIGPGEGALTRHLISRVRSLIVVDIDLRIIERLKAVFPPGVMVILHQDVLATDIGRLVTEYGTGSSERRRLRIIGNIPYNITTPILFHLLDQRIHIQDAIIMMQREVAERLVAVCGTKDYGILSVFFQLFADVRVLFDVSPEAFIPKPYVVSSVVRLVFLERPRYPVDDEQYFRGMVRGVFGKRRKTLRNSLRYWLGTEPAVDPAIADLRQRPEDLSVEQLVLLANALRRISPSGIG